MQKSRPSNSCLGYVEQDAVWNHVYNARIRTLFSWKLRNAVYRIQDVYLESAHTYIRLEYCHVVLYLVWVLQGEYYCRDYVVYIAWVSEPCCYYWQIFIYRNHDIVEAITLASPKSRIWPFHCNAYELHRVGMFISIGI